MKIAYYEENNYHTEIVCFILEYTSKHNIIVDFYNDRDQSYFIEHYEKAFNLKINKFKNIDLIGNIEHYDYIIIGTMGKSNHLDKIENIDKTKLIYIFHNFDDIGQKVDSNSKKIVLTPLNREIGYYVMPIFNNMELHNNRKRNNVIAVVGRFKNRDFGDILPLINNYQIKIFARNTKFLPSELLLLAKSNKNIKIILKASAEKMAHHLYEAQFILTIANKDSWYYKDRLTGSIPISFNYELPIIIPKELNQIYQLKGAIEYDNPVDIVEKIEQSDYNQLLIQLQKQKSDFIINNNIILNSFFNSTH